jgi:hypothetical protein
MLQMVKNYPLSDFLFSGYGLLEKPKLAGIKPVAQRHPLNSTSGNLK